MARKKRPETTPTQQAPERQEAPVEPFRILDGLRSLARPIQDLIHDPKNARKHPERNIRAIRASMDRLGQHRPLVARETPEGLVVMVGNGALEAARLDPPWPALAVLVVREGDAEATARALADNRTAELAEWDRAILGVELLGIQAAGLDPCLIGWDATELARLTKADRPGEDDAAELVAGIPDSVRGRVYSLGPHRLMCGDSAEPADVKELMGDRRAAVMATDPPYGVDYTKTKDGIPRSGFVDAVEHWGNITNDDLKDTVLQGFLERVFRTAVVGALVENAAWYLWHAHLTAGFFAAAAAAAADVLLHRQIIWRKPGFILTRSGMYHWGHEPCFFGWRRGHRPPWYGSKGQSTIWEIGRDTDRGLHPTQKPVELFVPPILNHTKPGEVVYEPFAGSGSQVIAAAQEKRVCCAMEIEPRFCDVIRRRWTAWAVREGVPPGDGALL